MQNPELQQNRESGKKEQGPVFKNLAEAEQYLSWTQNVPEVMRRIVEGVMKGRTVQLSKNLPHTDGFLSTLIESFEKKDFAGSGLDDELVRNILEPMAKTPSQKAYINLFELMVNPEMTWKFREDLYRTQIKPAFDWIVERDIEESMKKAEEELLKKREEAQDDKQKGDTKEDQDDEGYEVPQSSDESVSSMEAGAEKKEGAPKKQFVVYPYYGGYAKSHFFYKFDSRTLHFIPENRDRLGSQTGERGGNTAQDLEEVENIEYDKTSARIMSGLIRGGESLAIPMYYDFVIDPESIKIDAPKGSVELTKEDGIYRLRVNKPGVWNYRFVIGKRIMEERSTYIRGKTKSGRGKGRGEEKKEGDMPLAIPDECVTKITELKAENLPPMRLARELVKFVRSSLKYSNNKEAWEGYVNSPENFFRNIWQGKEADCHVSNTLAFRLLAEAGVTCRFVNGHYVKGRNKKGEAVMHSGSGHAWLEVWDSMSMKWLRLDATPSGDPTIDEVEQEKDLEEPKEKDEGDYGGDDDLIMDEKKLEEAISMMKKQKREVKLVSREDTVFAKEAGCTEAQAKEILDAFQRVREIKDENGESISEKLISEWERIVEERAVEQSEYTGPVKMSEGEILEDPVATLMDLGAGSFNPTGFSRETVEVKKAYDFGGINVLFSIDLSGSMSKPDSVSGRPKSDVQRDAIFLMVDSLMQCAFLHRRDSTETDLLPLKIMITVASDHGEVKLPLTDRWGPKEQWQFYSALKQLASGGTPTHETMDLIRQAITMENQELAQNNISEYRMPINYVIETSDGVPDDLGETLREHDKLARIKNTVVRGYVIGGTVIRRSEYTPLQSFSALATTMATDIIEQFQKLKPKIE